MMNYKVDVLIKGLAQWVTSRTTLKRCGRCLTFITVSTLLKSSGLALAQQGPIPAPQGLVAWWAGDGDARDLVGTNNGTLYGGADFTSGMVGQAFAFHSTGAQIIATAVGLPIGCADRSIECWVRIDNFAAVSPYEAFICGYGQFGSEGAAYELGEGSGQLFWSQWGNGIGGATLTTGVWYHMAATSSSGLTTLFLNGAEVASGLKPFITPDSPDFLMGYLDPGRALDGALDEVSVYDRALSADEIRGIYQAGSAGKIKSGPWFGPRLQVASSGKSIMVWWPANATGFVLETSSRLGATQNWGTFAGPIIAVGDQNLVVADTTGPSKFFRLRKP